MKVIPWILVVVLAGGCFFLFSQNNSKDTLIAELRQKLDENGKGSEVASDGSLSPDEIERLRQEAAEVYKLRGEVVQLRRDNQKMALQLKQLAVDDPSLQGIGGGTNDPFFEEFPPLTPEEEAQQELDLKHAIACVESLKILEDAKTKWATTNNKSGGDAAPMNEVMPFVPDQTMPVCPSGGTYVFNEVGVPASCSVEGHSLLP